MKKVLAITLAMVLMLSLSAIALANTHETEAGVDIIPISHYDWPPDDYPEIHEDLRSLDGLWFGEHQITYQAVEHESRDRDPGVDDTGRYIGVAVRFAQDFELTARITDFYVDGDEVNEGSDITLYLDFLASNGGARYLVNAYADVTLPANSSITDSLRIVKATGLQQNGENNNFYGTSNSWGANYYGLLEIPANAQRLGEATATIHWTMIWGAPGEATDPGA